MSKNFDNFIQYINEESYLLELDWADINYIKTVDQFKTASSLDVPLIILVFAVSFFMIDYLDCESCPLEEKHFDEFNLWISLKCKELES